MKCRNCRRVIETNSIFCNWCGAKQLKEEAEISVPRPRQLKSGSYSAQIMVAGKRVTVTEDTETKYYAKARSVKAGLIELRNRPVRYTLDELLSRYIQDNDNILSPATIRGYEAIRKHRFVSYSGIYIDSIDWQKMLNEEARIISEKTLKNAWSLVSAALSSQSIPVPDVNLPMVPKHELPWLDYLQIQVLLAGVRGSRLECPVILALHSLRLSELMALHSTDISSDTIHVHGAMVYDRHGCLIEKETNKTDSSARDIPILIPRLLEILPTGKLVDYHLNSLHKGINSKCRMLGLPEAGVHGLRRSFASLAYHLGWNERTIMAIGGWSNLATVHNIYVKLAQDDVNEDVKKMRNYYRITNADG